jgi:hypothetical protein
VTTSPATSEKGEVLFALSEGRVCGFACSSTVSIVGLDGRVHAKTTFTPPTGPALGCEGGLDASDMQVAAGSVYYLDSTGRVHRLKPSGESNVAATFPILTSQQITWFAVSPDGTKFMAAIVAFPPLVPGSGCAQHAPGDMQMQLVVASAGGPTTTIRSDRTPFVAAKGPPPHLMSVVGWDRAGPIAVTDTNAFGMGRIEGTVWWGPAAHLDAQGHPGAPIGGSDCDPAFGELPDGSLVCYDAKRPTVRDTAGKLLWSLKPLDPNDEFTYGNIALSPDGSHVAFTLNKQCCYVFDSSVVRSREGVRIGLGTSFQPQGWLDNQTVIGLKGTIGSSGGQGHTDFSPDGVALVRLATPTQIEPLGFDGTFLGVVQHP